MRPLARQHIPLDPLGADLRLNGVQLRVRMLQSDVDALSLIADEEGISLTTLINRTMRKAIREHNAD